MNRTIEFSSHAGNLSLVRRFVREFLMDQGCATSLIDLMVLGIDEACTNVIRYAYGNAEDQFMKLSLSSLRGTIRCRLRDYGVRPDLQKMNGRELEVVRPGGLGLHLIRQAFDRADYLPRPKGTELVLEKRIAPALEQSGPVMLRSFHAA